MKNKSTIVICLALTIYILAGLNQYTFQDALAQNTEFDNTITQGTLEDSDIILSAVNRPQADDVKLEDAKLENNADSPEQNKDENTASSDIEKDINLLEGIKDLEALNLKIIDEIERLKDQNKYITEQVKIAKSENKELKAAKDKVDKKNEMTKTMYDRIKAESLKLEAEIAKLDAQSAEIGEESVQLEDSISIFESQAKKIIAENKQLQEQQELIFKQSEKVRAENFKAEVDRIEAANTRIKMQKENLAKQSAKIKAESKQLEAESKQLEADSRQLEAKRLELRRAKDKDTKIDKPEDIISKKVQPKQEIIHKTPTIDRIIRNDQADLNLDIFSTNEGATVKLTAKDPILFKTMQLKNPNRTVIIFEGTMSVKNPQVPYNRVLESIDVRVNSGKTKITLNLKVNDAEAKYFERGTRILDVRLR